MTVYLVYDDNNAEDDGIVMLMIMMLMTAVMTMMKIITMMMIVMFSMSNFWLTPKSHVFKSSHFELPHNKILGHLFYTLLNLP